MTSFLISDILKKRSMNREFLIQLTNTLYRLTLFFPKKEPLRYKMRELADSFLIKPNEKDLEALDSFFDVALVQNWVSPSDMLAIKKEYANLVGELKKPKQEKKKPSFAKTSEGKDNPVVVETYHSDTERIEVKKRTEFSSPRQEKIIEFLKENGRAQVWQIKQILPDVSKRTLRRDFENMLGRGNIERMGERNNTFYQIKNIES